MRLDWDPPLDDGGVAITHYQISVNMSEPVITTDTVATFTLNSTGEHLVQVRAGNCAGVSDDALLMIAIATGTHDHNYYRYNMDLGRGVRGFRGPPELWK